MRTVHRGSTSPLFVALALALLLLAIPASAFGAAWTGQLSVPSAPRLNNQPVPQVGVDSAGNAVMAMLVDKSPQFVQVATRPVAGAWSATQEFGPLSGLNGVAGPSLAVDPAGNALLAYVDSSTTTPPCTGGASGCLHVLSKPAGSSTWSAEKTLTAGTAFLDPIVAIDGSSNGGGVVAWRTTPTAGNTAIRAINGTIGGTWSGVQVVQASTTLVLSQLHLAVDGAGRAVAMYLTTAAGGGCACTVRSAVGPGTWAAPTDRATSAATPFSQLFLRRNLQGDLDAAWAVTDATGNNDILSATSFNGASGSFGSNLTVATILASHNFSGPKIVTAADGEAVAAWTDDFTSATSVRAVNAATRSGGVWGTQVTLDSSTNDTNGPALAIDDAGNATAVWHNSATGTERFAVHPHGGAFGGTLDGPAGATAPVAAADSLGHVTAAWPVGTTAVDTAVFDPVAPAETITPAAPVDTLTATPVAFDATVSDIWSNPVAVHWDFGDGQSADGISASHAFAAAGSYLAKATATDASGNTASQTQTVTVAAPPITGGGGGLARPIAGKTVNLEPVSGVVLVKVPGSTAYVPLVSPTQVQNGSIIDARKGRVRITIDNGKGGLDTAEFYAGIFRFTQPKVKAGLTWFADLYLYGGSFKGCPRAPANPKIAWFSAAKRKTSNAKRSVRQLWGSGHGAFRTVGRFSSATIRGTTWLTNDRCDGTLTKVTSGKVGVRDFVLKKTIVLKAHKTYLAKPKPPAKHK